MRSFSDSRCLGLLILSLCRVSFAKDPVNITIDDSLGDQNTGVPVQYLPDQSDPFWKNQDQCTPDICKIRPSLDQSFDHTWTQATYFEPSQNMSIGFSFIGV